MNKTDLTTYLNDHHAGSLGALEMIDHVIEILEHKPLGQFFKQLRSRSKPINRLWRSLLKRSALTKAP